MHSFFFFFTLAPSCQTSSLLPSSFVVTLLAPEENIFLLKVPVYCCFLAFRRIGEYISLDLFYFVNLTSSCSLIETIIKLEGKVGDGDKMDVAKGCAKDQVGL